MAVMAVKAVVVLVVAALALLGTVKADTETVEESVLTPFGYWPKRCVHGVEEGTSVHVTHESSLLFASATGVRTVPSCSASLLSSQGSRKRAGQGSGWQAWTSQQAGNVTALLGTWTVPPKPSNKDDQTIFLFTGLQNIDWYPPEPEPSTGFDIIQPVLQFGNSAAGGYDEWYIASWYVTLTSDVVYSPLKQVNVGDVIFGNMTKTGSNTWYINTVDVTQGFKTDVSVNRPLLATQPWIYVTLEAYGIYSCDLFPTQPVTFNKLQLFVGGKEATPTWAVHDANPICPSKATIQSSTQVSIAFQ